MSKGRRHHRRLNAAARSASPDAAWAAVVAETAGQLAQQLCEAAAKGDEAEQIRLGGVAMADPHLAATVINLLARMVAESSDDHTT